MSQYIMQIQKEENVNEYNYHYEDGWVYDGGLGWLSRFFEVTQEAPIPVTWPDNRDQVVLTNTDSYNSIVKVYEDYPAIGDPVFFSYDEPGAKIDCIGAVTDSWPVN